MGNSNVAIILKKSFVKKRKILILFVYLFSITTGENGESESKEPVQVTIPENITVTEAIASAPTLFDAKNLPPVPANRQIYNWKKSEDAEEPDPC